MQEYNRKQKNEGSHQTQSIKQLIFGEELSYDSGNEEQFKQTDYATTDIEKVPFRSHNIL